MNNARWHQLANELGVTLAPEPTPWRVSLCRKPKQNAGRTVLKARVIQHTRLQRASRSIYVPYSFYRKRKSLKHKVWIADFDMRFVK